MQTLLGSLPTEFTDYWISRFPRLLSHSYHAMQQCSKHKEKSFKPYYSKDYQFSKPSYFYEITEDFVPTELPRIMRDSPKKFNKENRYNNRYNNERRFSPNDLENIGPNPNFRNFARTPPGFENNLKNNKKGSYNFHRNISDATQSTLQPPQHNQRQPSPSPSPAQQQQQQQPPLPQPVERKYVEDADGFVLVKPKHNTANVRQRNKSTANNEENIVWTLPK